MLGRHHDGGAAQDVALGVVLHGDLALAVRPQPAQLTALAHRRQTAAQGVGHSDGGGHQLRGLVAGVAEHHALVTGADVLVALTIHAHGDVLALLVDGGHDGAALGIKAVGGVVVADLVHCAADDAGDIHIAAGGDLTHDHHKAGGGHRLTGHPAIGVLGQDRVQHRIGDLVADFVGMSLGNRFRSKNTMCHLFSFLFAMQRHSKIALCRLRRHGMKFQRVGRGRPTCAKLHARAAFIFLWCALCA